MATTKILTIVDSAGQVIGSNDIGAEAQNIEIARDAEGKIIADIYEPGVTIESRQGVAEVLKNIEEAGSGLVFDDVPIVGSNNPVKSDGLVPDDGLDLESSRPVENRVITERLNEKISNFETSPSSWDTVPTQNSGKPITSGGVYSALNNVHINVDDELSTTSVNPVQNNVITSALNNKQNTLTFDNVPTENSSNPVTSGGVYNALNNVHIDVDNALSSTSENPVQNKVIYQALQNVGNLQYTIDGITDSYATVQNAIKDVTIDSTNYKKNVASGLFSHAEGVGTTAIGRASHAEGMNTSASSEYSHAEGSETTANYPQSHTEGYQTFANNYNSHAEGYCTIAEGNSSHAEGKETHSEGNYSHAEGFNTSASGESSHAEGGTYTGADPAGLTVASGDCSHAEGFGTTASSEASHAEGYKTLANGNQTHAEGYYTSASGEISHAEGSYTEANGNYSHAEGSHTIVYGDDAHAEGNSTTAARTHSHAEGLNTITTGIASHAEGYGTSASEARSHAEGDRTIASGINSHAEGCQTSASAPYCHTEGAYTKAVNDYSHAEGYTTTTAGQYSHAEGRQTVTYAMYSHAEGYGTSASGESSHTEGYETIASGDYSHAEGLYTTASGSNSHAEGTQTLASGDYSHAEGVNTTASGERSHAEGDGTSASGESSHAAGWNTIANAFQTVVGSVNVSQGSPNSYVSNSGYFIVGSGSSTKANCFRATETNTYGKAWSTGGADYAEMFEWSDGNINNEDRIGKFVTLDGDKIKLATSNDDYILGIISGNASVIGDIYDDQWKGMFETDIYGRPIYEKQERELKDGTKVYDDVLKVNPNYDSTREYIPRSERPEWDAVGLLGKLICLDDGTAEANDYITVNNDSIATKTSNRTKYRVMKRVDENHIQIMIL